MSRCRSCGAPIRWETTLADRPIPLDPGPRADGNLVILPSGRVASAVNQPPGPRYVAHFATCPNAKKHRKARPPTKEANRVERADADSRAAPAEGEDY